jgi:hypothetical protein
VITERDGKTTCKEHHEKKDDLESIDPKEPEIGRDRGEREEQCADQKRADKPIDLVEGYS